MIIASRKTFKNHSSACFAWLCVGANTRWPAYSLLLLWFFVACFLASLPAYVPDEAWFLMHAFASAYRAINGESWQQLLFHQNDFGYGGIWWSIYTVLVLLVHGLLDILQWPEAFVLIQQDHWQVRTRLFDYASSAMIAPMVMMRWLALLSLAALGVLLIRHGKNLPAVLLALLVLLSMPIAWWSGKLASPELISATLFAIAVIYWFVLHRAPTALVLSSLAVAVKLTVLPLALVLMLFIFWQSFTNVAPEKRYKILLAYSALCIGVFLASNLWLIVDPRSGFETLRLLSAKFHPHPDWKKQSQLILFLSETTWDGTNYGSLSYWAGGLPLVILSIVIAATINKSLALFLLLGGIAQYGFMMRQPSHGWYWFPFILALPVAYSQLRSNTVAAMVLVLIIFNAVTIQSKSILNELTYKQLHINELREVALQKNCILDALEKYQPKTVLDMAAIGTNATKSLKWLSKNYHDSFIYLLTNQHSKDEEFRVLVVGEKSFYIHPFIRSLVNSSSDLQMCGTIRILKI